MAKKLRISNRGTTKKKMLPTATASWRNLESVMGPEVGKMHFIGDTPARHIDLSPFWNVTLPRYNPAGAQRGWLIVEVWE